MCSLATTLLPASVVGPLIGAGGYLGALGVGLVGSNVGTVGTLILFTAAGVAGLMMWTEYLVFRAGRIVFAPAMVAAASVLPFGILFGFVHWFNGTAGEETEEDEYGEEEEYETDEDLSLIHI